MFLLGVFNRTLSIYDASSPVIPVALPVMIWEVSVSGTTLNHWIRYACNFSWEYHLLSIRSQTKHVVETKLNWNSVDASM